VVPEAGRVYEEKDLHLDLTTIDNSIAFDERDDDQLVLDIRTNGFLSCTATGEYAIRDDRIELDCYIGEYYPREGAAVVGTIVAHVLPCGNIEFEHLHLIERWSEPSD
jgi:hypothetical protein